MGTRKCANGGTSGVIRLPEAEAVGEGSESSVELGHQCAMKGCN